MRLCVDGEIFDAEKTEFQLVPEGINILKPINNNNYYQNIEGDKYNEKDFVSG